MPLDSPQSWTLADLTLSGGIYYSDPDNLPGGGGTDYPEPTHYAAADAAGSGDGSIGSPWTIDEAFANAVAGNVVQFAPGTYTGDSPRESSSADNFLCVWTPANEGTSENPIVFIAENPGSSNPTLYSKLAHTAPNDDTGCGLIHDNDYCQFIGFYIDASDALLCGDSGHFILQGTGSVVRDNYCDGISHTGFESAVDDNASFVRIEPGDGCHVRGNYVVNHGTGSPHHNGSCVMTYSAVNCRIYGNTFVDCDGGIYFKGAQTEQHGNWAYQNRIIDCATIGIEFGANTGEGRDRGFLNIISGCDLGIDVGRNGTTDVDLVGNTIYACTYGISVRLVGPVLRNNIITNCTTTAIWNRTGGAVSTAIDSDYNCFNGNADAVGSGDYSTEYDTGAQYLAGVQPGDEANSITSSPSFTNAAGGDFTLQVGSPAIDAALDYLNILGGGTSAEINMGAHIDARVIGSAL